MYCQAKRGKLYVNAPLKVMCHVRHASVYAAVQVCPWLLLLLFQITKIWVALNLVTDVVVVFVVVVQSYAQTWHRSQCVRLGAYVTMAAACVRLSACLLPHKCIYLNVDCCCCCCLLFCCGAFLLKKLKVFSKRACVCVCVVHNSCRNRIWQCHIP